MAAPSMMWQAMSRVLAQFTLADPPWTSPGIPEERPNAAHGKAALDHYRRKGCRGSATTSPHPQPACSAPQRDIPMPLVTSGVEKGNLRELALARMGALGMHCRCVRGPPRPPAFAFAFAFACAHPPHPCVQQCNKALALHSIGALGLNWGCGAGSAPSGLGGRWGHQGLPFR